MARTSKQVRNDIFVFILRLDSPKQKCDGFHMTALVETIQKQIRRGLSAVSVALVGPMVQHEGRL